MTVSVIMAVHNGAKYVAAALDSVFAQTRPATEVIVVNDGSTDDTAAVLQHYAGRIVVLSQDNQGLAKSRNRALDAATGDAIAILDADDIWEPAKLERQVSYLTDRPDRAVVHTAALYIDVSGTVTSRARRPGTPPDGWCYEELLCHNTIFVSSVIMRRSALGGMRFVTDANGCEDWDLWLRLATAHQFGYIDEPLLRYRVHSTNMSTNKVSMCLMRIQVMNHVLERERAPKMRRLARWQRRLSIRQLGHLHFLRGNLVEARGFFQRLGIFLEPADARRLIFSYVPLAWHARLRALKRRLIGSRGGAE